MNFVTWSRRCIAPESKSFSTWFTTTRQKAMPSGPTLSFKGIDNPTYYILEQDRIPIFELYSGTGNTLNGNHRVVRRMILDSLRYWVDDMHVDGFRFDLASILARDSSRASAGQPASPLGH